MGHLKMQSLVSIIIHATLACREVSQYINDVETPIPIHSLDICFAQNSNETNYSFIWSCTDNGNLIMKEYDNAITCDKPLSFNKTIDNPEYITNCNGSTCEYAMIRTYESTLCESIGDYTVIPYPVNYCLKTELNGIDGTYYVSARCNKSSVALKVYAFSDCSDEGIVYDILYQNGTCNHNNQIIQITFCDEMPDNTENLTELIRYWFEIAIVCFLFSIACVWITIKVFVNLYIIKHNWIIPPSSSNKLYAVISSISFSLNFLSVTTIYALIVDILYTDNYAMSASVIWDYSSSVLLTIFPIIAQSYYYLYLTSTLEYHMEYEKLIRIKAPKYLIKYIKYLTITISMQYIGDNIISFCFSDFGSNPYYITGNGIIAVVRDGFIQLSILYLYYSGLNNVCHYYYSQNREEYDKYGENQRTHEVIKSITRVTVVVIVSIVSFFLSAVVSVLYFYLIWDQDNTAVVAFIMIISQNINYITSALSMYFIYPFGQMHYDRICGLCDSKFNEKFKKRHQKQVNKRKCDGKEHNPYNNLLLIND